MLSAAVADELLSPRERLLGHALLLHLWLERPTRVPARWTSPSFSRSVELVRAHLRPITDQDLLALSYTSEALHTTAARPLHTPGLDSRHAIEIAYAVRWLELDRDAHLGEWLTLVAPAYIDSHRAGRRADPAGDWVHGGRRRGDRPGRRSAETADLLEWSR